MNVINVNMDMRETAEKLTLSPGKKRRVTLGEREMPATLIRGRQDGMTLLVTAGVHPDEYPGMTALVRLAEAVDPAELKGRLLLIHCVNPDGFRARSRTVPEDGFNLNSGYPGRHGGSLGERIADFFVSQIFPETDFIIDLHSGSPTERLAPCLFFPAAAGEQVRRVSLAAAEASDVPWLVASQTRNGMYSYAANFMGIPGLLMERGDGGRNLGQWSAAYERDLALLLNHLGMYPAHELLNNGAVREQDRKKSESTKFIFERAVYLTSECEGLWYPAVELPGQRVSKGDLLGRIENFYGEVLREYRAPEDGLVLYYLAGLAVNRGDLLVAFGTTESMRPL